MDLREKMEEAKKKRKKKMAVKKLQGSNIAEKINWHGKKKKEKKKSY